MQETASYITELKVAFLRFKYTALALLVIILFPVYIFVAWNQQVNLCYLVGSVLSSTASYVGKSIATADTVCTISAYVLTLSFKSNVLLRACAIMGPTVAVVALTEFAVSYQRYVHASR